MSNPATDIHVLVADITALMIGGDWWNVDSVLVSFADYTWTLPGGLSATHARGLHVAATVTSGPHNGDRIVAPIGQVQAVRLG